MNSLKTKLCDQFVYYFYAVTTFSPELIKYLSSHLCLHMCKYAYDHHVPEHYLGEMNLRL